MVTEPTIFKPKVIGGFAQRGRRGRNKPPKRQKAPLTIKQILAWADARYARTGQWPRSKVGRIYDAPHETWVAVEHALSRGYRGLPGGSSLAKLLAERRGVRNPCSLPGLSIEQILAWADANRKRTGKWPQVESGRIHGAPLAEKWKNVDKALSAGIRGLSGGMTLAKLLIERRGMQSKSALPKLTVEQILAWADAHHVQVRRASSSSVKGTSLRRKSEPHVVVSLDLDRGRLTMQFAEG